MSEHVLPPLLTEAEREACAAGAYVLDERARRLREVGAMRDGKMREQQAATLRALADRKAGSEYAAPGGSLASRKPPARQDDEFAEYLEMLIQQYPSAQSLGGTFLTVLLQENAAMLRDRAKRLSPADAPSAGVCGMCGGRGYVYEGAAVTGRGPDDVFPEQAPCPDCNGTARVAASDTQEPTRGGKP